MAVQETTKQRGNKMIVYLVVAFGWTWVGWIVSLVVADRQGYLLPTIATLPELIEFGFKGPEHIFYSILFQLAVFGPLIGGFVAVWLEEGQAGVWSLLRSMGRWRVGLKWYGVVVGIALLLPLIPLVVGILTGLSGLANVSFGMFLPFLVYQLLTSGLGEEPGWRGYLLPHLQERFAPRRAVWILGFIWAAWHYPFTIFDTFSNMVDMPPPAIVITLVISLAGFTLSIIGITYIYVWFYNHTQSVFLAILFHTLTNVFPALLLGGADMTLGLMQALMPWVVVIILERALGKTRFPGEVVLSEPL